MELYNRVRADIDLDAFVNNLDEIKRLINPGTQVIGVIKTDAYGHGAIPLATIMEQRPEIWGYAVAEVEEGRILKNHDINKPVLILGYTFPDQYEEIVSGEMRPAVFSLETARLLSEEAVRQDKEVFVHIKLDTGMSRVGYQITEEAADEILAISRLPHLTVEGIFTHFARADETDKTFTRQQAEVYAAMIEMLKDRGLEIPIHHVSNSAGIVDLPEYNMDLVRAGIILYGLWPSDEVLKERIHMKPLMSLKSHIVHVKTLEEGRRISYGGTYVVEGTRRIATIPVGYGDGYPRSLSNCGYVLIHGKKAPICGRVCMDQFMVDVTDIPEAEVLDEVVLIGMSEGEYLSMDTLAELSGRFNYEFACDLSKRIPRVFFRDGEPVFEYDHFSL